MCWTTNFLLYLYRGGGGGSLDRFPFFQCMLPTVFMRFLFCCLLNLLHFIINCVCRVWRGGTVHVLAVLGCGVSCFKGCGVGVAFLCEVGWYAGMRLSAVRATAVPCLCLARTQHSYVCVHVPCMCAYVYASWACVYTMTALCRRARVCGFVVCHVCTIYITM